MSDTTPVALPADIDLDNPDTLTDDQLTRLDALIHRVNDLICGQDIEVRRLRSICGDVLHAVRTGEDEPTSFDLDDLLVSDHPDGRKYHVYWREELVFRSTGDPFGTPEVWHPGPWMSEIADLVPAARRAAAARQKAAVARSLLAEWERRRREWTRARQRADRLAEVGD